MMLGVVVFLGLRSNRFWWAAVGRLPRRAVPAGGRAARGPGRGRGGARLARARRRSRAWRGSVAVVAPVAGAAAYLAWVGAEFGDFWKPISLQNQATLRGGFQDPVTRTVDAVGDLFGGDRFGSGLHIVWAVVLRRCCSSCSSAASRRRTRSTARPRCCSDCRRTTSTRSSATAGARSRSCSRWRVGHRPRRGGARGLRARRRGARRLRHAGVPGRPGTLTGPEEPGPGRHRPVDCRGAQPGDLPPRLHAPIPGATLEQCQREPTHADPRSCVRRRRRARRRHHRGRTGRAHRGLHAHQAGRAADGARVRPGRRRDQPHRGARRLALRHRRPPVLHQGEAGQRPLVRDPRSRRLPAPPADEPHPLPRQALRLPDQAAERAEEPRPGRSGAVRVLVPLGEGPPAEEPGHARGLRRRQLRLAALQPLLQDLQREGLGRLGVGDRRRLGRTAHQGHVAVRRGVGADPGQGDRQPRQVEAGHQPDRGVQLPQVRPRPDVGEVHRARHRRRRPRSRSTPRS